MTAKSILRFLPVVAMLLVGLWIWRLDALRADYRQTLTNERAAWSSTIADAEKARLGDEVRFAQQQASAAQTYAATLAARQPIIIHSRDTVTRYAQTPDGRALCLPANRVRGAQADRDALFANPAGSAGGGRYPLPAGPADHPG